ncbi:helicase protein [Haloferula helveola]|uniref:Helicase protein n=1 Tax=Haloferula helveola TaxID=490095 RepID=A0ABM7RJ57_9BACT|nr:helicase protein [Haloferula helveola]
MSDQDDLATHLENRDLLVSAIVGEVFGPGSSLEAEQNLLDEPTEFDLSKPVTFADQKEHRSNRPVDKATGEEILREDRPLNRYGMGVLFPEEDEVVQEDDEERNASAEASAGPEEDGGEEAEEKAREERTKAEDARIRKIEKRAAKIKGPDSGGDDEDIASDAADLRVTNLRRQRGIGISFVVDSAGAGDLVIRVTGGRYQRFKNVRIADGKDRREIVWWVRRKVDHEIRIPFLEIKAADGFLPSRPVEVPTGEGLPPIDLRLEVLVRGRSRIPGNDHPGTARLLTITLVNRSQCKSRDALDLLCLFQAHFVASAPGSDDSAILPYPESGNAGGGSEQQSLELLYRNEHVFATGHGCAGAWDADEYAKHARAVRAEVVPWCETPQITPRLYYRDAPGAPEKELSIPLHLLADESRTGEALAQLRLLLELYSKWIEDRTAEIPGLEPRFRPAAERHLKACSASLERMQTGLKLLERDPDSDIPLAFRLTNRAMLLQALASGIKTRSRNFDAKTKRVTYEPPYAEPDLASGKAIARAWRPFQLAFLLMNLPALADPSDPSREIVDLIWFPTGGGKTEAYLGCAAFSLFMRRLKDPTDTGTEVLMRYTLRLLTAQQFQRASSLVCAMNQIRGDLSGRLGTKPYRIGIWVGGDTTPNKRADALIAYKDTKRFGEESYKMVLLKCPWCGAPMGPRKAGGRSGGHEIDGARQKTGSDVILHCPDTDCSFSKQLPVEVTDENLYENPPDYVIATVDKFASLAWREECRSLFGLAGDGSRKASPPGLIIQDELHLITGPLGSMVGLYETLIDELATDRRDNELGFKPKLIAATATTRASDRQIRDLYARKTTAIFPAPGLDAADSFFACYDRQNSGARKPGRRYLGFLPVNYSSALTASVRLYAAALAAALGFKTDEERDPWWTLLVFYNSLRELGANLTLFGADIPQRLYDIQRRWYPRKSRRVLYELLELTGRLANSDVPRALEALERPYKTKPRKGFYPIDACLASNIIEVGVDVDRLGLMGVAGQPKTTAQYIQATGRVGRRLPGLILMNYGAMKARDRSHYEHFQAYHTRLYAQVEPASVTPFTIPVLDRALHAVLVAYVRQTLPEDDLGSPTPFAGTDLETAARKVYQLLRNRIAVITPDDAVRDRALEDLRDCFERRLAEWKRYHPAKWSEYFPSKEKAGDVPLIRPYGSPCPTEWEGQTWETPNSLRGVDADCRLRIPPTPETETSTGS